MEKDGEENILHLRMTGCEQGVMGAAKECSLRNIVMSVATPFGRSQQVFPPELYLVIQKRDKERVV